jgi:hypothetical protein
MKKRMESIEVLALRFGALLLWPVLFPWRMLKVIANTRETGSETNPYGWGSVLWPIAAAILAVLLAFTTWLYEIGPPTEIGNQLFVVYLVGGVLYVVIMGLGLPAEGEEDYSSINKGLWSIFCGIFLGAFVFYGILYLSLI